MSRLLGLVVLGGALPVLALAQDAPDEAKGQKALDERFLPALVELAKLYNGKGDPEACCFFCECALGFGAGDAEALKGLKKKWEDEVYYGRVRGGVVLKDAAPIEKAMGGLGKEYRAIVEELLKKGASKEGLTDAQKQVMWACVVRSELARGAHEYVQATQRFNELRRSMKLRAILWDFENSSKLILGGWYMGETGDWRGEDTDKAAVSYTANVEFAKNETNLLPRGQGSRSIDYAFPDLADEIRALALIRMSLLNPDARRLWLANWSGGKKEWTEWIRMYSIPRGVYRPDIATPSRHYGRETVAEEKDRWTDLEERIRIGGKDLVLSKYPYEGESDAPWSYGSGIELSWNDPKPDTWRCGLPIMIRFFVEAELTDVETELRKDKGWPVGCRRYLTGDERVDLKPCATILLIPEKRLDKDTKYHITIKCKVGGTPYERKWSFTTRAK